MNDTPYSLAAAGFHVFPCVRNGKLPVIKKFPDRATRNPEQIHNWWPVADNRNIGISTTRFGDDKALIVVDVDDKDDKHGSETMLALEMQGFEFPRTFEQRTVSGGRHLIYWAEEAATQGVNVLGSGLDIRSKGGYIVGPGSWIDGACYTVTHGVEHICRAPQWLIDRLGVAQDRPAKAAEVVAGVDPARAEARGREYIASIAPLGEAGGRNDAAYKVAARLKDFGCTPETTFALLLEWNETCEPPLEADELEHCVNSAYTYGKEAQGSAAPEAVFSTVTPDQTKLHPIDEINKEYAMVKIGSCILHETTDHNGRPIAQRLNITEFKHWFANHQIQYGKKSVPLADDWMTSKRRRQYDGVVFAPERKIEDRFYNLWRGFKYQPAATGDHPAVKMFLDHALNNVCGGDVKLFKWLIGYFAHMVQRPWEKPLVALVFQGGKGVGKNALIERIGALFGVHTIVADNDRYLLSNFNAHMESCILLVLDEASWAGDKRAEGRLKGLITGSQHNIEHKGKEPYTVDNLTRVVIIGNEDWLVPASQDERRFAVFKVGDGRKQDRQFFHDMRVGLENGGYPHLLRYLLDYDLTGIDVNDAPATAALAEQKRHTAPPVHQWLEDCLIANTLAGSGLGGPIPEICGPNEMLRFMHKWAKDNNIYSRGVRHLDLQRFLLTALPSFTFKKVAGAKVNAGEKTRQFHNPGIDQLRADWDKYTGVKNDWSE